MSFIWPLSGFRQVCIRFSQMFWSVPPSGWNVQLLNTSWVTEYQTGIIFRVWWVQTRGSEDPAASLQGNAAGLTCPPKLPQWQVKIQFLTGSSLTWTCWFNDNKRINDVLFCHHWTSADFCLSHSAWWEKQLRFLEKYCFHINKGCLHSQTDFMSSKLTSLWHWLP